MSSFIARSVGEVANHAAELGVIVERGIGFIARTTRFGEAVQWHEGVCLRAIGVGLLSLVGVGLAGYQHLSQKLVSSTLVSVSAEGVAYALPKGQMLLTASRTPIDLTVVAQAAGVNAQMGLLQAQINQPADVASAETALVQARQQFQAAIDAAKAAGQ